MWLLRTKDAHGDGLLANREGLPKGSSGRMPRGSDVFSQLRQPRCRLSPVQKLPWSGEYVAYPPLPPPGQPLGQAPVPVPDSSF